MIKIISFIFVLPYIFSMLWTGNGIQAEPEAAGGGDALSDSRVILRLEDTHGSLIMTMEEYLCGYLPYVIPAWYEPECLRAQAILLRTEVIGRMQKQSQQDSGAFTLPVDTYLTQGQLEEMWGGNYKEYQEKIRQAVCSTQGVYLTYEGLPIEACFFRVSAGQTRSAEELLGQEYKYLRGVYCSKDYLSDEYLTHYTYKKTKLEKLLGGSITQLDYDSFGYLVKATITSQQDSVYSGEWFRKKLNLPSAHITAEESKDEILFHVKGVGHGFGMSQFAANEMAKEGADYRTILSYFFQNITFDKYE